MQPFTGDRGAGKQLAAMAIDQYTRVADNLAAIAATLYAMRAIERHGGAEILERAFTGFTALPAPDWKLTLGLDGDVTKEEIDKAFRKLSMRFHPDHGGDAGEFHKLVQAREEGLKSV